MAVENLLPFAPSRAWASASPPPKACVVNEDRAVLASLKFMLKTAGFNVRAFASGRGLLASPWLRSADCFVLDHRPRGQDGLRLAKRLRMLGLAAPIVLTTGFRCGVLETYAGAIEKVIAAARLDEALIQRLLAMIALTRAAGLRQTP
jgi:two-component system response regulator FixJ